MAARKLVILKACSHPRYSHVAEWKEGGKRRQKFVDSVGAGKLFVEGKSLELSVASPDEGPITKGERLAVMEARREGVDLLVAVREAVRVRDLEPVEAGGTLAEMGAGKLVELERMRVSRTYLGNFRAFLTRLQGDWGAGRLANSITPADCATWLHSQGWGPVSVRHYRTYLVALFNFGKVHGLCLGNPAASVRLPKVDYAPVSILTPEEGARLLGACEESIVPAVAIALFAGLRPDSELRRLTWDQVMLDRGLIEVVGKNTRTAARRLVTIQPALRAWLEAWLGRNPGASGAVCPLRTTMRRAFRRAKEAAGWGTKRGMLPWPQDVLRHSFASYHFAAFGDAGRTAMELGHTTTKKLFSNYREVVTPEAAGRFWGLRPGPMM